MAARSLGESPVSGQKCTEVGAAISGGMMQRQRPASGDGWAQNLLRMPVDCRNSTSMMIGTRYLVMTTYSLFYPNFFPPRSISSTIHSGSITQPIKMEESMAIKGIMKLLLI